MKRLVVISTVTAILIAGVFSSCKKQDKEELKQQKQESFEKNLKSYPADFKAFVGDLIKENEYQKKISLGKIKLPRGMKIAYKKGGETYSGKLEKDVYFLRKNGKTFMKDGSRVIQHGSASLVRFSIKPFEGGYWKVNSILPYNRYYAFTITDNEGKHPGPAYESYEALKELWGNPKVYVQEPHPDYIVEKGKRVYLIKDNGEFWKIRPERETSYAIIK